MSVCQICLTLPLEFEQNQCHEGVVNGLNSGSQKHLPVNIISGPSVSFLEVMNVPIQFVCLSL